MRCECCAKRSRRHRRPRVELRDQYRPAADDTEFPRSCRRCDGHSDERSSKLECSGRDELWRLVWYFEPTAGRCDEYADTQLHADTRWKHDVLLADHRLQRQRYGNRASVVVHDGGGSATGPLDAYAARRNNRISGHRDAPVECAWGDDL